MTADRATTKVSAALGVVLVMFATLTMAQVARASTIHACVKPESGVTRIVGAKAKCRRSEHKLSWSTTGPRGAGSQGATGLQGVEGKAGTNGTGASYEAKSVQVLLPFASKTTVATKILPPGSYVLAAKTTLIAESAAKGFGFGICELDDQPGTSGAGELTAEDATAWGGPLGENEPNEWQADSPLILEGSLTSSVTSTLTMFCENAAASSLKAFASRLHALTVTAVN